MKRQCHEETRRFAVDKDPPPQPRIERRAARFEPQLQNPDALGERGVESPDHVEDDEQHETLVRVKPCELIPSDAGEPHPKAGCEDGEQGEKRGNSGLESLIVHLGP